MNPGEKGMNEILKNRLAGSGTSKQQGATLIEYVLIVAVIAIAVFATVGTGLSTKIADVFTSASSTIQTNVPE